jgi:hypothetical protein
MTSPSYVPASNNQKVNDNRTDKMPRPIFPPNNRIQTYDKNGFRKGLATFPPPEEIF